MDRRKGGNRDANGGLADATVTRLRFETDEEAEEVGMEVEESLDREGEGEQAAAEVIGSEKTSADYYFDSYSHFGTRAPAVRFRVIFRQIWMLCTESFGLGLLMGRRKWHFLVWL